MPAGARCPASSSPAAWPSTTGPRLPVPEERAGNPGSLYGASKLAGETLARTFTAGNGLTVTALRFAGVYGGSGCGDGALLSATLDRVVRRILAGEEVTLPAGLRRVPRRLPPRGRGEARPTGVPPHDGPIRHRRPLVTTRTDEGVHAMTVSGFLSVSRKPPWS
ncbi:NAD-dependent epimerase/dehydratase family protein [Lipingzhangella sp. LS1_29]|uniref:NAD-dependent epimerase/dehydratase family protein n=1 Tax=Lipingzhangella rawalii TaxID=2055835 RepID=A0ABU2H666_9ACTN|nr:NAD-dependent epimerase/dehydratase family protein [Lipingzhangella rawalii]MDS1270339.1 NAD-dependent epimerase/dehydratase family protein [Lipingzhangella rawalii]